MSETNCVFCKIVAGEIPSSTIYEDDSFRVIMDISPASKGHAILIPKKHAANIFEISDEDASKIFIVAKKVAIAMKEELQCEGINILQNNGEIAGQTVFHLHVHLIPRYPDDRVTIKFAEKDSYDDDFAAIAKAIGDRIK